MINNDLITPHNAPRSYMRSWAPNCTSPFRSLGMFIQQQKHAANNHRKLSQPFKPTNSNNTTFSTPIDCDTKSSLYGLQCPPQHHIERWFSHRESLVGHNKVHCDRCWNLVSLAKTPFHQQNGFKTTVFSTFWWAQQLLTSLFHHHIVLIMSQQPIIINPILANVLQQRICPTWLHVSNNEYDQQPQPLSN